MMIKVDFTYNRASIDTKKRDYGDKSFLKNKREPKEIKGIDEDDAEIDKEQGK
jgi:hypothetical protein